MDNLTLEENLNIILSWPVESLLKIKEAINNIPDNLDVEFAKKLYVACIDCVIEFKEKCESI